ncbi:BnaC02g06930D [Brassica napus]|uniref:BnaC02g06930D protein n=1 Tax=Brassica napus TaxID=3708 RepID=A0A078HI20_BRANA|nr:BnaC02g06930D [Brassica napus]
MASNKHFSKIPSNLSNNSDANDPPRPYVPNTVTFARRTNSGRYVNYSRDDLDSEIGSVDFNNYTVHMPPTPDNQTTDPSISQKVEEQYVSNSMFTGGFNSTTKAHLMDKRLPGGEGGGSKMERRLSLMKSNNKSAMVRSQTGDFDQNQWLFETSGTYGYGNAFWTKDGNFGSGKDGDGDNMETQDLMNKPWKPLTRKLNIPAAVLSPYRLLILIRVVVLALFLSWRIKHQNQDAIWLWGMSVVCELWFAFSWLLDQLPKLCPVNRSTDLQVLKENNPTGKSDLPGLDVFVSTADPEKEPPLVTANTILSILAADYPCEKLACYVSDDGGALLTFEAMAEAASFANIWVPFCRKHAIEPRNPDSYFSLKRDPYKNKVKPDFVKDRRRVKREYDEFKVRINSLPDSIRRRSDAYHAREEIKAMKMQRQNRDDELLEPVKIKKATDEPLHGDSEGFIDLNDVDIRLPLLVYVSREKRPGYDHNKKAGAMNALVRASAVMSNGAFILNLDCDHYIYNSEAMREGMCFMMDRGGDRLCYVQFPQRFEGIDPSDRYANHNTVFFDVNMRALDGLMGPVYVGTGCLFRRIALYGFDPPRSRERSSGCCGFPKKFGNSTFLLDSIPLLDASTVAEAIAVISCWYEDKTEWGSRIGWIYGSVTEDVVTGYRMHNRGWKSVYCVTKRDAFRGTAPINLTDRLHQVLRWATGSVEIFFSRNNALLASPKMKILQRIAYLNVGIYPFTSIFLIVYCFLPALSLFSGQFIVQTLNVTFLFWLIGGTSAHLAAVLQGLLKVIAGVEISFTLTTKSGGDDVDDEFADLYMVKWTSLMIPPITIMMVNLIAIAVGFSRTIYAVVPQWSKLIGGVFFSFWVLAHLYPFAKGLMGRRGRTPTIVYVWAGLIAITISLLWVAINPPAGNTEIGGSFSFP